MLAEERYANILTILRQRGFAKVEDLANTLEVSEMTIRRDLEKCQTAGILTRCHGGAILSRLNQQEISFDDKSCANGCIKKSIAKACSEFVSEGMSVFLDAGTTTYEIAQIIQSTPKIAVTTNDIRIAYSLLNSSVELTLLGGGIQKTTGSMTGQLSEQMISQMFFDISFIGANSINANLDVMTPTAEKMFFKRSLIKRSNQNCLAVDHSKFQQHALYSICNLSEYSGVVTDYTFNEAEQAIIKEKDIVIIPVCALNNFS